MNSCERKPRQKKPIFDVSKNGSPPKQLQRYINCHITYCLRKLCCWFVICHIMTRKMMHKKAWLPRQKAGSLIDEYRVPLNYFFFTYFLCKNWKNCYNYNYMQRFKLGATIKAQIIINWVLEIPGLLNTQYFDKKH